MHRLFVGLCPPAPARARLLALAGEVEGARWQDEDQLHLTLRYVGEVASRQADDLAEALERVSVAPVSLTLAGVGHFERKGAARTLWAGVAPSEPLRMLQGRVEQACRRAGSPPETRRFAPHVTLARLNRASGPVGGWMARNGTFRAGEWPVEEMVLYESHLSPLGSEYDPVIRYSLRG